MVSLGNLNLKLNLDVDADSLRFFRAQKITRSAAFWNNNRRCLASDHALSAPREIQSPKTMNILGAGIHAQLRKTFRMKVNFPFPS